MASTFRVVAEVGSGDGAVRRALADSVRLNPGGWGGDEEEEEEQEEEEEEEEEGEEEEEEEEEETLK